MEAGLENSVNDALEKLANDMSTRTDRRNDARL